MAQLNSRGTQTRNRWDYYEFSNGFAYVSGNVSSGPIGAYLANNSTGATALDIYNFTWASSILEVWEVLFLLPPLVLTPFPANESFVHPLALGHAAPPGAVGMFSAFSSAFYAIKRYSNGTNNDSLAPIMGTYFVTLPPGWAIAIYGATASNPCELSVSIWYQYVTDNIAPAQ